jgi:hypothetical protein
MRKIIYFLTLSLLILTLSCGGGGSSSGGGSGGQSPGPGWPSGDYNYLNQHNASFNNGIIIRWQTPILVNTNGISGAEDAMRQWGLPFTFVNYNPAEGITLNIGNPGPGACGVTYSQWNSANGRIVSANIIISSNLQGCVGTITHETGHAIGFENHTTDGGLMDADGGNGQITSPVRNMINLLYSLPIGTNITPVLSINSQSLLPRLETRQVPDGGRIVTRVIQ